MNKLFFVIPVALSLAACATGPKPELITTQYKVVTPPSTMYNCPTIKQFPNADTLTDEQVGQLLVKLQSNNVRCKTSIEAIRKYLTDAKATIEKKKSVY